MKFPIHPDEKAINVAFFTMKTTSSNGEQPNNWSVASEMGQRPVNILRLGRKIDETSPTILWYSFGKWSFYLLSFVDFCNILGYHFRRMNIIYLPSHPFLVCL